MLRSAMNDNVEAKLSSGKMGDMLMFSMAVMGENVE